MLAYVFPIFPRAAMQLPDHATVQLLRNQVQEDLVVAVQDYACVLLRQQLSGPKVQPPVIWEWDQEHQEHVMDLQPVVEKDQPDYLQEQGEDWGMVIVEEEPGSELWQQQLQLHAVYNQWEMSFDAHPSVSATPPDDFFLEQMDSYEIQM